MKLHTNITIVQVRAVRWDTSSFREKMRNHRLQTCLQIDHGIEAIYYRVWGTSSFGEKTWNHCLQTSLSSDNGTDD